MEFINEDDGVQFHVVKDVLAIVGNDAELRALAPKEKYKPTQPQSPEDLRPVIKAVLESRTGGPKFKFKSLLGEYPVPAALRNFLEQVTNPIDLIHAFRECLPTGETNLEASPSETSIEKQYLNVVSELDVDTYPLLWTSLLHVEEVALQWVGAPTYVVTGSHYDSIRLTGLISLAITCTRNIWRRVGTNLSN